MSQRIHIEDTRITISHYRTPHGYHPDDCIEVRTYDVVNSGIYIHDSDTLIIIEEASSGPADNVQALLRKSRNSLFSTSGQAYLKNIILASGKSETEATSMVAELLEKIANTTSSESTIVAHENLVEMQKGLGLSDQRMHTLKFDHAAQTMKLSTTRNVIDDLTFTMTLKDALSSILTVDPVMSASFGGTSTTAPKFTVLLTQSADTELFNEVKLPTDHALIAAEEKARVVSSDALRALDPVQLIWQAKDAEFKLVTAFSNASLVGTPWDNIIDQVNNKAHAFLAAQVDDVKAELASVLAHVVAKTSKIEADVQSNPAKWLKPDVWTDPEQMAFVTEPNNRQMTPYVAGEHYFFGYWQEIECTDLLTDTVQTEFAHINAGKMWMVAPGDMLLLEGTTLDGEQKKLKGENLHLQVPALIQPWLDFYGTLTKDRLETPKEGFAESYECAFDPPIQYDPLQMGEGNYVMFAGVQVHLQVSGEITVGDQFHGKFAEKVGAYAGFSIPLNEFTHVVNVSGVPRRWMVRPNDSRPLNEVAVWQVENWVGPFGVDSFLRSMQRQHESDVGFVQMNCKSLCGKILENVFDDPTLGPSSGFNGGPSPLEILNLSRISEFAQNTFDGPLRPLGIDDMPTLLEGYSYAAEKGTVVSSNFNPATVDPKLEGVVPTGTFPFQCGDDGLFGIKGYRDVFKNPFVHETGNDARQLYPTAIYIDSVAARACMQCLNEFTTAELFGTGGSPPGADGTGGSIDYSTALSRIAINARLDKWFTTPVIPSTHQLLDSIAPIPPPPTPSPGWSWTFSDEILKVVELFRGPAASPFPSGRCSAVNWRHATPSASAVRTMSSTRRARYLMASTTRRTRRSTTSSLYVKSTSAATAPRQTHTSTNGPRSPRSSGTRYHQTNGRWRPKI